MKATLNFDLPDDQYKFNDAVNGEKYRAILFMLSEDLYQAVNWNRHERHETDDYYRGITYCRNVLRHLAEKHNVSDILT